MVVNKLVHHLDTLVHFPACTLLGNYEVSKIGNSWKLIHFEMCSCMYVCAYVHTTLLCELLHMLDFESAECIGW